jgi:DNA/RNA-binding domain of Phe-tRNA-synthetase-like protein
LNIEVKWSPEVAQRFSRLAICIGIIDNIRVEKENDQNKTFKKAVYEEARAKHNAETLKDNPTVRAYRDMYWRLSIDPTKTRPSGEALLRRVLNGNDLPNISTVVDEYNLASMKTMVPISGFDLDRLTPPFQIRFAKDNETFAGIGMAKPLSLTSNTLVLADERQIICIYPYRDADNTKITTTSHSVMIVGYGAPEISFSQLREAVGMALSFIKQASGGQIGMVETFQSLPDQ